MKLEPSFVDHWKTRRLYRQCGADAVLGLLRLWGQAQIKREWAGLPLTPSKLAALMEYPGDAAVLWQAMTDKDSPWLDAEPDGTWTLHGFADHQAQIIRLWDIGKRGGRPKGSSPTPPSPTIHTSSSSCPISQPNGNHMVFQTPTLEELKQAAQGMGVAEDIATIFWNECESRPITPDGYWTGKDGRPMQRWMNALKAFGERWKANEQRNGRSLAQNGRSGLSTKPMGVWEAKERKTALKAELDRLQSDSRYRRTLEETPWQTEWTAEGREKAKEIRNQIAKLDEVITGRRASCL